jgi:hypothetical protein
MQDQPDEAIRIADKIKDKQLYDVFSSVIRFQIALRFINSSELDSAILFGRDINFPPQRVEIFNKIAQTQISKKNTQRASQVIRDIQEWLEKLPNNPQKVKGLLIVAATAATIDSLQGFETLKLAVNAMDNVDNAEFTIRQKSITNNSETPVTLEMLEFTKSFGVLAHSDIERTILIAQSIKNKDASILAQIGICQSVLSSKKISPSP